MDGFGLALLAAAHPVGLLVYPIRAMRTRGIGNHD